MAHTDTRIRYTKAILKQSMLKLLTKKPIGRITVKELCEEAQINRGTFYLHYGEPNDVLMEIENEFIEENMQFFKPYIKDPTRKDNLSELFSCLMKNADLCSILMGPHGAPQFFERMQNMFREAILDDWQNEFPDYSREDLEFVYEFILPGAMRMTLKWAKDSSGLTPKQLGLRLDRLGHYCHLAIREFI